LFVAQDTKLLRGIEREFGAQDRAVFGISFVVQFDGVLAQPVLDAYALATDFDR
jgi:hypothetical protein